MLELLRSDKVAGLITGALGVAMFIFGLFALVIVAFQRLIMSLPAPPANQPAGFEHFDEMMRTVQGLFITYLPFTIAGGIVFGVAGFYVYRGSVFARRVGQINAILGVVWIGVYMIASYRVMQTMIDLPMYQSPGIQWASIIINLLLFLAFPITIFLILKRPKIAEPMPDPVS